MFRTRWSNYLVANKLENILEREKIAALLSTIGDDCLKFYNNLPLTENERNTADKILKALAKNLTPSVNIIHERAKFIVMKQEQTESADEYINRLREAVKNCQYGEKADEIVRDRLVVTVEDMVLRRRYYECTTLTLIEAIDGLWWVE
jgi:uncharacterized membrane protein YgaE (UPF0421/DUF939 family)